MTSDEHDLTPEEEREISRLLAEAGGPVATPPEVTARLDDVLADLVSERGAVTGSPVVPLEAERRRRRWPRALLAAAAVTAGGYGLGTALLGTTMSGSDSSAAGESSAESSDAGAGGAVSGGAEDGRALTGRSQARSDDGAADGTARLRQRPPLLRVDRLGADVARVIDGSAAQQRGVTEPSPTSVERGPNDVRTSCVPAALDSGDSWYLVRYDGRRAVLVTSPPVDGLVDASVVSCDGERLASVQVPAP